MLSSKRFKPNQTTIEVLPNELFLEIFSYLNHIDTVFAFIKQNERFRSLTLNYCNSFNFQCVEKLKFDFIIREHDLRRWKSVNLSNDDRTPGQLNYFIQVMHSSNYLQELKQLSIRQINKNHLQNYISIFNSLNHLVSLRLTGWICTEKFSPTMFPSLKHLKIHSCLSTCWMQNSNSLVTVHYNIEHSCFHAKVLKWPKNLKNLEIFYRQAEDEPYIRQSLKNLSNLKDLSLCGSAWEGPAPSGRIWEELIRTSMKELKNFRFSIQFWRDVNLLGDVNSLMESFSTPFYLEEKKCFVQCDFHQRSYSSAIIYTLPYAFEQFDMVTDSSRCSMATNSGKNIVKNLYGQVRHLNVEMSSEQIDNNFMIAPIEVLTVKFYRKPLDWLLLLRNIREMTLLHRIEMTPADFLCLLRTFENFESLSMPCETLRSLTNNWCHQNVCTQLSQKIRTLKILPIKTLRKSLEDYVKIDDWVSIMRVFHRRCQHLVITVYSRNLVIGILQSMKQLKSLRATVKQHDNMKISENWIIEQDASLGELNFFIDVENDEYSFWISNRL